jgi:phage-related minor tail protein
MATGGIVMRPTAALVGEAGPEAIIPLDRMGKMGGNSYNITVQAGVGDPAAIGQQIVTYIKKFERSGGPVFASA